MGSRGWTILVLIVLLAIFVVGPGELAPTVFAFLVRGLLLIIILLLLFLALRPADQKRIRKSPSAFDDTHEVGPEQTGVALQQAGILKLLDKRQAKLFALAVTAPADIRKGVVESYEPEERTLRQTVTIDASVKGRFNGGQGGFVYFPVAIPPKGKLLDGLKVVDASGQQLPVLSYREYILVATTVLRLMLSSACRGQRDTNESGMTDAALEAEEHAVGLLLRRNTKSRPIKKDQIRAVVAEIKALPGLLIDDPRAKSVLGAREMAAKLVEKLADHYAIVAPIQPNGDGRFVICYTQILIPDLDLKRESSKWMSKLVGSATVALGARPVDLTIGIENASTCQSYHLTVDGLEGQGLYLVEQQGIDLAKTLEKSARGAPTKPHPRFRKRLGQSHAHFYVRYFPEPADGEQPRVRFRYFEVPPGSLLRAGITAAAGFMLVWLIGLITRFRNDPGTDAPAVLLAFPALAATWLGFEKRGSRLLEGTYAARRCLLFTAVISLAAAAIFMAHKQIEKFGDPLPFGMSILGVTDIYWSVLVCCALVNFTFVAYSYIVHTWEYCYLAERPQAWNTAARRG